MNLKAQLTASICLLALGSHAADLSSSGDWTQGIGASDLTAGAGSDLAAQFESPTSATTQNIDNTGGAAWTLKARKSDQTWRGDLTIFVKRTSDGSGSGAISGGTTYVALSSMDQEIFSGTGDRSNISLQYKVTGMSTAVSPSSYSTGIIFTVE